jgi:hypothetical protein
VKTELRFDRAPLTRQPKRTPQGFLEVDGDIARPGIYEYRGADGNVIRELKPPEVLEASLAAYDALSITVGHPRRDGELIPVTADNVRAHEVGTVRGPARMEAGRAVATLVIKDAKAIRDVEAGRRELSPGYAVDLDETPGADKRWAYPSNPEGRYDTVARRIVPNHLALVDYARGGPQMRLRMDEAERVDGWGDAKLTTAVNGHQHLIDRCGYDGVQRSSGTTTWAVSEGAENGHGHTHDWVIGADGAITIGLSEGHTHEILVEDRYRAATGAARGDGQIDRSGHGHESGRMADPETPPADAAEKLRLLTLRADEAERLAVQRADELTTARRDADSARAELTTARERITALEAKLAAGASEVETAALADLKRRYDEVDRELTELKRSQPEKVRKRAALITRAQAVVGPKLRCDGMTDREIAVAGIKALRPKEDTSSNVSDDFLLRRFDSLVDDAMAHDASLARASRSAVVNRADDNTGPKPAPRPWADQWKDGAGQFATNRPKEA